MWKDEERTWVIYIYIYLTQAQFIHNIKHKEILEVICADSLLRLFQYIPLLRPAGLSYVHTRPFLDLKPERGYLSLNSSLDTSVQCRQDSVSQCYRLIELLVPRLYLITWPWCFTFNTYVAWGGIAGMDSWPTGRGSKHTSSERFLKADLTSHLRLYESLQKCRWTSPLPTADLSYSVFKQKLTYILAELAHLTKSDFLLQKSL